MNWNTGKNFHRTVLFDIDTVDGQVTWTAGYISTIQRSTCPSLFSISPHMAPNLGVTQITDLAGSFFWEGMEVWLERDGTRIDASNVAVVSPYEATCEFDLQGAKAGTYDVVSRNPNGLEGRLPGGFKVTSPNTWYLPEGSTGSDAAGSFETWVLVENPNAGTADVDHHLHDPGRRGSRAAANHGRREQAHGERGRHRPRMSGACPPGWRPARPWWRSGPCTGAPAAPTASAPTAPSGWTISHAIGSWPRAPPAPSPGGPSRPGCWCRTPPIRRPTSTSPI